QLRHEAQVVELESDVQAARVELLVDGERLPVVVLRVGETPALVRDVAERIQRGGGFAALGIDGARDGERLFEPLRRAVEVAADRGRDAGRGERFRFMRAAGRELAAQVEG